MTSPIQATLAADEKIARLDVMEDVLLGRRDGGSPSALRLRASLAETGVTPRHSLDLLIAFRRDATKLRYADWGELYDYCRYSAMPVGRHVLDLHGEDRATYVPSDALCTSLQVLNHLQDCAQGSGGAGSLLPAAGVLGRRVARPRRPPEWTAACVRRPAGSRRSLNRSAVDLPRADARPPAAA